MSINEIEVDETKQELIIVGYGGGIASIKALLESHRLHDKIELITPEISENLIRDKNGYLIENTGIMCKPQKKRTKLSAMERLLSSKKKPQV